ncbi:sodium:proton antiporter NhaD [Vibrio spartinae]|uniref:Na(+)/H(+) antiporter NhaD n=1 Tax=Vibrio spartinae TaxID=1918945 RepID=A0A1N6M8Q7_9VIBR|nr:sodium:proton antiporter NhaD [Vibrio spartinae]QMV16303.1 Na+/H+ antiporter, NhaD family [Vibrio spartinae]SIO95841.1 Na(+)/H(+) antiporter NhaD [Vibrio spartinae]
MTTRSAGRFLILLLCLFPFLSVASTHSSPVSSIDMTHSWAGYACVILFIIAYITVTFEETIKLKKSKPVLLAAGIIWAIIGFSYQQIDQMEVAKAAFEKNLLEYAELLLFLLVAMTYINAMEERRLFDTLRSWMVSKGFSYAALFWLTGLLAFFISPVADNLTTALLMCAVVMKVSENNPHFVNLCCINIVIAANAGGAFSPFGDITTLMVWQAGMAGFLQFFNLFIPSVVNYMLPALLMSYFLPKGCPNLVQDHVAPKRGAKRIVALFLLTILTAVSFHALFEFPPVVGMMMGLAYLQFFGYYLQKSLPRFLARQKALALANHDETTLKRLGSIVPFDVFKRISHAEWDTLLFFYGIVMSVGGLSLLGYLSLISGTIYPHWGAQWANIFMGALSAIIDNIPIMYAVLTMNPIMSDGNWLLITLTAGVGGSLLSIGSAAGVALMGASHGQYTFLSHLRWTPVIALGYAASIVTHIWLNQAQF